MADCGRMLARRKADWTLLGLLTYGLTFKLAIP